MASTLPDAYGPPDGYLRQEMSLLELLFDDPSLSRLQKRFPRHPAVRRYELMHQFLAGALPLRFPNENDVVCQLGAILLDGFLLFGRSADELMRLFDAEVLRQLRRRVNDSNQFDDQMCALGCWSMLMSKNITAQIVEAEGLPDVRVSREGNPPFHWIEAKGFRLGKTPKQTRSVIRHANRQIERAGDGVGSVYLYIERAEHRVVFDDNVPPGVQPYIDEVYRELGSGFSESVSEVIVAWDDYMLLGTPPERTVYVFRRRSTVLAHKAPHARSALQAGALEVGRTVVLPIRWSALEEVEVIPLPPIKAAGITVTELFRKECELPGYVRSVHAVEALSNAKAITRYSIDNLTILLAVRRIAQGTEPYTLLIIAAERNAVTEIYLGLRIYYGDDYTENAAAPWDAFETLLKRYGTRISVGRYSGMFIPAARPERTAGEPTPLVRADGARAEERPLVHAMFKLEKRTVDVVWAFALLTAKYAADVGRRRR